MSEAVTRRRLLALVKPPKPVGEMTDAELDAWVDKVFDSIRPQVAENDVDEGE